MSMNQVVAPRSATGTNKNQSMLASGGRGADELLKGFLDSFVHSKFKDMLAIFAPNATYRMIGVGSAEEFIWKNANVLVSNLAQIRQGMGTNIELKLDCIENQGDSAKCTWKLNGDSTSGVTYHNSGSIVVRSEGGLIRDVEETLDINAVKTLLGN